MIIKPLHSNDLFWLYYDGFQSSCHIILTLRVLSNMKNCNVEIIEESDLKKYATEMGSRLMLAFNNC